MIDSRSRGVRKPHPFVAAVLLAALAIPAVSGLAGCSTLEGTGGQDYITGEGVASEIKPAERGEPVELSGTTLDGDEVDVEDLRGEVVVINIWGSWCPPCREEMPDLVAVANSYAEGSGVHFLGINTRETSPDDARAFVRSREIPFPSLDDQGGRSLLALRSALPPTATPSTLVLDREGRVAARVLGPIPTQTTLRTLIDTVVAEKPVAPKSDGQKPVGERG